MSVIKFASICHVIRFRKKLSGVAISNHYDLVVYFSSHKMSFYIQLFSFLVFQRDGHSEPIHLFYILILG